MQASARSASARAARRWRWRRRARCASAWRRRTAPAASRFEVVRHQDHRRPHPGPAAGRGRRQGAVHQGDRGGAAGRRDRPRRAFHEGHADRAAGWPRHRRCLLPREDVRDAFISAKAASLAELPGRRRGRHLVAAAAGAGAAICGPTSRSSRLRGNVETRLRKLAGGRRRCHAAGLRRPASGWASRTASRRRLPTEDDAAGRGPGRHRRRDPRRRRGHRRSCWRRSIISRRRWPSRPSARSSPSSKAPAARRSPGLAELAGGRSVVPRHDPHARRAPVPRDAARGPARGGIRTGRGRRRRAAGQAGPDFFARARLMRLLVTRPEPDALKLRAALRGARPRGHRRAAADVSLRGRRADRPRRRAGADRHQPQRACARSSRIACSAPRAQLPLFAVGQATRRRRARLGFEMVVTGAGTAHELVAHIVVGGRPGGRPAAASGRRYAGRRSRRASWRRRASASMQPRRLSHAAAAGAFARRPIEQLALGEIDGVILMSPRTAAIYAALMRKHGLVSVARELIHFCLSEAVARRLAAAGRRAASRSRRRPRLEEVLALIDAAAAKSDG